jgi:crossover junction endodeoxyribonuclease RusA
VPLRLDLPYPHKLLWPNGSRGNHRAVAGEKRKHRDWAALEMLGKSLPTLGHEPLPIKLTVHPMPKGPLPDRDNCVAALKVYLDAISKGIGINDKNFAAPTVEFALTRTGRFVIEVGA